MTAASLWLCWERDPGLWCIQGKCSDTEPGKGFVLCCLVIRLVPPHCCEQGLGWRTRGKGVSGLVAAVDDAIHTTQVQVDEATVIRLSPIVYNKELVKTRVIGSDDPAATPTQKLSRTEHIKQTGIL